MTEATQLKNQLFKAFLTLFRSKKLVENYTSEEEFFVRTLKTKELEAYCEKFGFVEAVPLPYFYLICQGIHSYQMIDKKFPLPLPGMVHLESKFETLKNIDPSLSITIKSGVSIINKESGSLIPVFEDHFYQEGQKVLEVNSIYLVKRKKRGGSPSKKEFIDEKEYDNWISFLWRIAGNTGRKYAKLTGDYNPIHLFTFFAWFFGFRKKIIQGWYLASRAVAEVEKDTHMPAKSLKVKFEKAVYLPSNSVFEYRLSSERNFQFRMLDTKRKTRYISGRIS